MTTTRGVFIETELTSIFNAETKLIQSPAVNSKELIHATISSIDWLSHAKSPKCSSRFSDR